jgi:hypothetical protein
LNHLVLVGKGNINDGKTRIERKQLLDVLRETRGYWKLKEEAPDCTLWRTRFERGCGPVVKTEYRVTNKNANPCCSAAIKYFVVVTNRSRRC